MYTYICTCTYTCTYTCIERESARASERASEKRERERERTGQKKRETERERTGEREEGGTLSGWTATISALCRSLTVLNLHFCKYINPIQFMIKKELIFVVDGFQPFGPWCKYEWQCVEIGKRNSPCSTLCSHVCTRLPSLPPAHMNHVKIFKGWPLRDAPSMLVQLWYTTFPPDRFLSGGNEQTNYVE